MQIEAGDRREVGGVADVDGRIRRNAGEPILERLE